MSTIRCAVQRSHYAAWFDRETGEFKRFPLDEGTGPHNLIVDDDGIVFYAGNRVRQIGKLDPETGDIEKFWMPDEAARDPHTLVFGGDDDLCSRSRAATSSDISPAGPATCTS